MKKKLGILTGLVLSLAIAGSAFASNLKPNAQNNSKNATAVKSSQTKKAKTKKHSKHHKTAKKATMKKDSSATTPPSK